MSNNKPKTWNDLRATGILLRILKGIKTAIEADKTVNGFVEGQEKRVQTLFEKRFRFLHSFLYPTIKESLRDTIDSQARILGPNGFLALCDLENRGKLTDVAALLALHVHCALMTQVNDNFCIRLVDENTNELEAIEWPEILPSKYEGEMVKADASFCYKVSYVVDKVEHKTSNLIVKTMKLGGKIIVNAVLGEDDHFSSQLKTSDYISVGKNFPERYAEAVHSLSPDNVGLNEFISRAALQQLGEKITNDILKPVFDKVCPEEMRARAGEVESRSRNPRPQLYPVLQEEPQARGRGLRVPNPTRPINPAGYGHSDLVPNLGPFAPIGGNLLGPGHPAFGGNRPGMRPPDGVPPGARWDPMGPGHQGPRRPGQNGRGGRRNGDHFPPPSFNGGGFSGF